MFRKKKKSKDLKQQQNRNLNLIDNKILEIGLLK